MSRKKQAGLLRALDIFDGSQTKLADAIGVTQVAISLALKRGGTMSARNAIRIERATGGRVKRYEICPDLAEEAAQ